MDKSFEPKIVSANDLLEGDVVYLGKDFSWTRAIDEAVVAEDAAAAETLLVSADQPGKVVGPYLLDVMRRDQVVQPRHFRERFRDSGPTLLDAVFARRLSANISQQNATQQGDL